MHGHLRRGVIDGVDFGYTGEVRFVLKDDIARQLDGGNVVLLSNLGGWLAWARACMALI